jgi:enediyne biosynthesis protein E4
VAAEHCRFILGQYRTAAMMQFMRHHGANFATCSTAATLYFLALPHHLTSEERSVLAARLRLSASYLESPDNRRPMRTVRKVHPSLQRLKAWISSVGASVARADIADTGRLADICLVDPRNDSVSVLAAPGTGDRYPLFFALPTPADDHDPRTIAPMRCLPRMDLVVHYWSRTPIVFLRNDAPELSAAAFTPIEIVRQREIWNTNAAILADVDGDGHPDLVFGNCFHDGERVLGPRARSGCPSAPMA